MARLMAIATQHKGGTIWIKRVILSLSKAIGVPWFGIWSDREMSRVPQKGRAFLVNWAGAFPDALYERHDVSFAHVIRDPRDVLLSGCDYHKIAGVKGEEFLHIPRGDLGGATYQEHLNGLSDPEEQLLFEMMNKHANTIAEMCDWPYGDPRSDELRYEDLMKDTDCRRFGAMLDHLGLQSDEIEIGKRAFWDNSLFGGLADVSKRKGRFATHIKSGGRLHRWQSELPRAVGQVYASQFGDDLIALGYEQDIAWAGRLPESVAA